MNEHFARLGFDGVRAVPRTPGGAGAGGAGALLQNLGGFIVTMPHKTAILDLVDEATPVARKIGAANVVRRDADGRLTAHMLDGEGFVGGLIEAGVDPKGKSAWPARRRGQRIGFALAQAGVARLTIANRTTAKAEDLKARILSLLPDARIDIGTADPSGHDLVVNGTCWACATRIRCRWTPAA